MCPYYYDVVDVERVVIYTWLLLCILPSFFPSSPHSNNWWHAMYEIGPSKVMVGGGQRCERRALAEIGNLAGAMNTRCNVSKDGFLKPAVPGCSRYRLPSTL